MTTESSVPDIELDEIMEKIRAEANRRQAAPPPYSTIQSHAAKQEDSSAWPTPFEAPLLALDAPLIAPKDGLINFRDLAGYHDAAFVANVYRALLRREPDQTGFVHYLSVLRAGRSSKAEIAWYIKHSPEGIVIAAPLAGLLRPFLIGRAFKVPVAGPLLHWFYSIFTIHRKLNHMERIEAAMCARETILAQQANDGFVGVAEAINGQQTSLQAAKIAAERAAQGSRAAHDELASKTARLEAGLEVSRKESLDQTVALRAGQDHARETQAALRDELSRLAGEHASAIKNFPRLEKELEKVSADARAVHEKLGLRTAKLEAALAPIERSLAWRASDQFYSDLEARFRGTEESIESRAEVYLPYIKKARAGQQGLPVLDLGCGRGEWLGLLRSRGLEGIGVDRNGLFLEALQKKDIATQKGDLLEFLKSRPEGSAGAVTGIHVLEHLPFAHLLDVLTETARVLAPGGVAIFETPNPANLSVGAHTFYLDPTHLKPIPSALLAFLVERAGLVNIETVEIHPPSQSALPPPDSGLPPELVGHFARPQDYFVVGWKK